MDSVCGYFFLKTEEGVLEHYLRSVYQIFLERKRIIFE